MWSRLLLPSTRTRSLRTLAVSDFGCAKTTRRNCSGSSESSSIRLMALADSPASPTASGDRSARSPVSYPSFVSIAVMASGEARSATSLAVRSRSVGCGTGGLRNFDGQEYCRHVLILSRQHRRKQQERTPGGWGGGCFLAGQLHLQELTF